MHVLGTPISPIINTYCTTENTYSYYYQNNLSKRSTAYRVNKEALKGYTETLGKSYEDDEFNINAGYPILWWESANIELNKKQAYIKENEKMQLSIVQDEKVIDTIKVSIDETDFTWASTNEDIATVDENGMVTGLKERIHNYICKT
jgi:hypothetical protein